MCKPAMLRDAVIALCWMKKCNKLLKVYTQKRKRIFHLTDAVHLLELYVEFVLLEHFLHKCTQKSICDSHFWLKVICYYSSQTCAADWLPFCSPILSQLSSLGRCALHYTAGYSRFLFSSESACRLTLISRYSLESFISCQGGWGCRMRGVESAVHTNI